MAANTSDGALLLVKKFGLSLLSGRTGLLVLKIVRCNAEGMVVGDQKCQNTGTKKVATTKKSSSKGSPSFQ
jgi:hypothetical protein